MRRGPGERAPGLVAGSGLAAGECQLLHASTEAHGQLRVRMRREDVALELSNFADSEPNAAREYTVLVSTGRRNERLVLRRLEALTVRLPVLASGRRALVEVAFEVRQVRAVVAGLRSSELVHRALVRIGATGD